MQGSVRQEPLTDACTTQACLGVQLQRKGGSAQCDSLHWAEKRSARCMNSKRCIVREGGLVGSRQVDGGGAQGPKLEFTLGVNLFGGPAEPQSWDSDSDCGSRAPWLQMVQHARCACMMLT